MPTPLVRLNLGGGSEKVPGYLNVDKAPFPGTDVTCDLDTFPWPWADGSVDRVRAFDIFEHVWHPLEFMQECWRVLRPGGILDMHTVHHRSPNYHRDPDHKRGLDEQSFDFWVQGTYLNQRYGPAYTGGFAVFEYADRPHLVNGMEIAVLLRKPVKP